MTTYIKDLIDLPERVHGGDFVLKLTEGVARPEATLDAYVVTPELARNFDDALGFIKGAVHAASSKAAYLHGSFGSGKSHFMAVLHLVLDQNPAAKSKRGLTEVVVRHNDWLTGKRFLLVPYHMIGQPSMEAAVLGGYVDRVLALHPEAPIPAVYRAAGLLRDAETLRGNMGDAAFFEQLNRAGGGRGGWGELEAGWDASSFAAALTAPPGADARDGLIGALVKAFFQSYTEVARGGQETFVSLDDGLAVMSRHARDLGYDAVVLFLDELILWLATHAGDRQFLSTEGSKVSKLVEAQTADRPIPIVSFVARQRDLRELVGEDGVGAEQLSFANVLRWWEARFDTITLEDRNLPEIAAQRVLLPKSEAARQQLAAAWEDTARIRAEVLSILLTPTADRDAFRKVYPFSPALVETLIAVSSVLQRERTALKVMLLLLVSQRDTLELGQIVPVGDLFDVIADGDEPFTEGMRIHFDNAKRLYYQKLLPLLEQEHGTGAQALTALDFDDPRARAFRADDRLMKTLLLAALVPQVDSLKGLNAARLAALNHGSIRSPIPGREKQEVLRRVRNWASQVGEIKVGEGADPSVTLHLSGVDTEGILANAQGVDNLGNRRRKVRELLFEQLGIENRDELFLEHELLWRGTRRAFQVIFGNVRELPDESLETKGGSRKLVIDFPFDDPAHSPADDLARVDAFRAAGRTARTLVWLPAFLSVQAQRDLGILVRLDDILRSEDNLRRYASHLTAVEQAQARELLRNQQSSLRQRIINWLEGAYGVDTPAPGSVDDATRPDSHFHVLDPSLTPQPPVGANLGQALLHLLSQMLESQYPAHPRFGTEVKLGVLRKVQAEVERAAQTEDGRVLIDKALRPLMQQIAVPLRLGNMGEDHFALTREWYDHCSRQVQGPITVAKLRAAMDQPKPMGLPVQAQNLVILLYADQANRSFHLHGGPYPPKLEDMPDDLELREQALPSAADWEQAIHRASKVFGLAVSPLRNAGNVSTLADKLGALARAELETCQVLADRLAALCSDWGISQDDSARLRSAVAVLTLLGGLVAESDPKRRVEYLATASLPEPLDALGTSRCKAPDVRSGIEATKWELFAAVAGIGDERKSAADDLVARLAEALRHDEFALALKPRLAVLEGKAIALLAPGKQVPKTGPGAGKVQPEDGAAVIGSGDDRGLSGAGAKDVVAALLERLSSEPDLKLDLAWTLYKDGPGA
jgi:hypothetical protein